MKLQFSVLFVGFVLFSSILSAQSFKIGHTSKVLFDGNRNRNVQTEIYYPSTSAGENVPLAIGSFPVIVFGHGYRMSWESYQNFWTELVPDGYVICFPTTEKGVIPNHKDFGLDIRFVGIQMQAENVNSASIFFNSLSSKTALMGHSMGGGASFLAAENNSNVSTLVNFAAAETNPSAISAANTITVPSLIFSGDDDCVTPPSTHQDLMYDNLASACKNQISIIDGGHCYFADYNVGCSLGESSCNPSLVISREEQQSVTFDFLKLWLAYSLYDDQNALVHFNDSLQTSTRISFSQFCNKTDIRKINSYDGIEIFPNPVIDFLNLSFHTNSDEGKLAEIFSISGKLIESYVINGSVKKLDVHALTQGVYLLKITWGEQILARRIVKIN